LQTELFAGSLVRCSSPQRVQVSGHCVHRLDRPCGANQGQALHASDARGRTHAPPIASTVNEPGATSVLPASSTACTAAQSTARELLGLLSDSKGQRAHPASPAASLLPQAPPPPPPSARQARPSSRQPLPRRAATACGCPA
jgi:hypothetical protein